VSIMVCLHSSYMHLFFCKLPHDVEPLTWHCNFCRYEASLHPALLKNTKFTFDASFLEDEKCFKKGNHLYHGFLCKSPNLQIVGLDENFNAKYFIVSNCAVMC